MASRAEDTNVGETSGKPALPQAPARSAWRVAATVFLLTRSFFFVLAYAASYLLSGDTQGVPRRNALEIWSGVEPRSWIGLAASGLATWALLGALYKVSRERWGHDVAARALLYAAVSPATALLIAPLRPVFLIAALATLVSSLLLGRLATGRPALHDAILAASTVAAAFGVILYTRGQWLV